jgi:hypothetical protein
MFEQCPKRFYALKVAKTHKAEDGVASAAGTRDHKSLEDRLMVGAALPPHLAKHEPLCDTITKTDLIVKAEEELAVTKELEPCEWWHRDVYLRVKADVGLYTATTAGLLDWKTGKRKPKPFQLELGALTQFIHYPNIKSTEAAFLWLKDDASDRYKFTRADDYHRILAKLKAKVERVEDAVADGVWQAKPSWLCNYCELKDECSYSQARR